MLTLRKFKITNPYAGVDWDSWHHYKTNLHTHSTASDAQVDFSDMIKAYYDAGFDILAMTSNRLHPAEFDGAVKINSSRFTAAPRCAGTCRG